MATDVTDRRHGVSAGLGLKAPCRVATTANITLSGLQSIDGVTVEAGDRVLVKDQTDGTENGIWSVATGAWSRAVDFNGQRDVVSGTQVFVVSGATQFARQYYLQTAGTITIGTTSLSFAAVNVVAGDLSGADVYRDALKYRDFINQTQGAGTIVIDETGVTECSAGIETWLAAAAAAGVFDLFWPEGNYKIAAASKPRAFTRIRGVKWKTIINCINCSGFESFTPTEVQHGVTIENFFLSGRDHQEFLDGTATPNTLDNVGIHFKHSARCFAYGCFVQHFTYGYRINGDDTGSNTSGAQDTFIVDCHTGLGTFLQPHGNNNWPLAGVYIHGNESNGNFSPDYVGCARCEIYNRGHVSTQFFDGDNSTTSFQLATIANGMLLLDEKQLFVEISGVRLTSGVHYTVSGVGTATPTVNFSGGTSPFGAPASGSGNIEFQFTPFDIGSRGFWYRHVNGGSILDCGFSGWEFGVEFGERGCYAMGGYGQIYHTAFVFASGSNHCRVDLSSIGLTESTGRRVISDSGSNNLYLDGNISDRRVTSGDLTVSTTGSFTMDGGTALAPSGTRADGSYRFDVSGVVKLEQNGGSPSTLGATFGIGWFNPDTAAFEETTINNLRVESEGTGTVRLPVALMMYFANQTDKARDSDPTFRLAIEPDVNTTVTLLAGAQLACAEDHFHEQ